MNWARANVAYHTPAPQFYYMVSPTHYGMSADWPAETLMTVTFDEQEGKTHLTLRQAGIPITPEREGAVQGWNESFDRLAEYVGGRQ